MRNSVERFREVYKQSASIGSLVNRLHPWVCGSKQGHFTTWMSSEPKLSGLYWHVPVWVTAVSFGANSLASRRGSPAGHFVVWTSDEKDSWCSMWSHFWWILRHYGWRYAVAIDSALKKNKLLLNVSLPIWSCWESSRDVTNAATRRCCSPGTFGRVRGSRLQTVHQRSRTTFLRLWSGDETPELTKPASVKKIRRTRRGRRHRHWFAAAAAGIRAACY